MVVLTLPRLVSGRDIASDMVSALGDITGCDVLIDARATSAGTGSFAARLVRDTLVRKHARQLTLVGAPADFQGFIEESADKLGVRGQLEVIRHMPAIASARH